MWLRQLLLALILALRAGGVAIPVATRLGRRAVAGAAAVESALLGRGNLRAASALYVPATNELAPTACAVISGAVPTDLPPGALLRVGPNPDPAEHAARRGQGAFLDGDGMIHVIALHGDACAPTYARRWVDTAGRRAERQVVDARRRVNAEGSSELRFFDGTLCYAPRGWGLLASMARNMLAFGRATKDTANTALALHGGKLLALMEQLRRKVALVRRIDYRPALLQGLPSELALTRSGDLRTVGAATSLDGAIPDEAMIGGALAAHGRTCVRTGERVSVSYGSSGKPFGRLDIFKAGSWKLRESRPLGALDAPVMIHDSEITQKYVLVLDFPLTVRPIRLLADNFPVQFESSTRARIGVLPRGKGAEGDSGAWVEVEACVVLHSVSATELDDGTIRLIALRAVPADGGSFISNYCPSFLHEWTLELAPSGKSGRCVSERCLNAQVAVEFPTLNPRCIGSTTPAAYAYALPFDGFVKLQLLDDAARDVAAGEMVGRYTLPSGEMAVSEPTFVPSSGRGGRAADQLDEDEGCD
ncbi:carotenoid oxygenase [Pavlovales sp. CCMP2436]|nr:carotenoid oxygenase [Pavlovales sp. CCMP2436]